MPYIDHNHHASSRHRAAAARNRSNGFIPEAAIRIEHPPTPIFRWRCYSGKAYVLPVPAGRLLPASITSQIPSEQEIVKLPGVRVISGRDVMPGPTADIYAFTRQSVQRNLYRVPVP